MVEGRPDDAPETGSGVGPVGYGVRSGEEPVQPHPSTRPVPPGLRAGHARTLWLPPSPRSSSTSATTARRRACPRPQVIALHQDRRGFLWVGTYGGLSRYDGRTFHTLTARDGLSANRVTDVVETADGTLVAATIGGGVCFVANGRVVDCLREADGLADDEVNDLFADGDGSVWVATTNGLTELRNRRLVRTFRMADGLPVGRGPEGLAARRDVGPHVRGRRPSCIGDDFEPGRFLPARPGRRGGAADRRRHASSAGSAGLVRYHDGRRRAHPPAGPGRTPPCSPTRRWTAWVALWFTTPEGRARLREREGASASPRRTASRRTATDRVLVDRDGVVWFGTEGGLSKLVPGPFALLGEESGLPDQTARALALDQDGTPVGRHAQWRSRAGG